jgi:hypothetical protein
MREYIVDVSAVTSWAEFIAVVNRDFICQVGGNWKGSLDAFDDYLYWPDEHPYRLVVRDWDACAPAVNVHKTWDGRPVLDVIAEIFQDNPQMELVTEGQRPS